MIIYVESSAAALRVQAEVMVTYDQRQAQAAREAGIGVLSPR